MVASEIDLFKDLKIAEKCLKISIDKEEKRYWKHQVSWITKEIKKDYPDLVWNMIFNPKGGNK